MAARLCSHDIESWITETISVKYDLISAKNILITKLEREIINEQKIRYPGNRTRSGYLLSWQHLKEKSGLYNI